MTRRTRQSPTLRTLAFCLLGSSVLWSTACDRPGAYGDASSIVAAVSGETWAEVEDSVYRALEPTLYTVRDEKTFTVTHVDPADTARWSQLQQFRQLLLVGPASDRWISQALGKAGVESLEAPAIEQAFDVWARGQTVTMVVTPEGEDAAASAFATLLPELGALYDQQFRQLALNRMYVSGVDTLLADTLASRVGFRMLFPIVYRRSVRDSVYIFRNDNPDPSELIRQVGVSWRTPLPDSLELSPALALEWRQELADANYGDEQVLDTSRVFDAMVDVNGREALEVQAVWRSPPDAWPAAGPFIARLIPCPEQDRLYLVDAWLYAPGREKYEYMIQLETLLNSFECSAGPATPVAAAGPAPERPMILATAAGPAS